MSEVTDSFSDGVPVKYKTLAFFLPAFPQEKLAADIPFLLFQISTALALFAYFIAGLTMPTATFFTHCIVILMVTLCTTALFRAISSLYPTSDGTAKMSEFPNTGNATRLSDTATDPSIRELESQKLRQTIEDMRASVPESIRTHVRDATMDLEQRNHDLSRQIQERTNEINILQEQALRDEAQIARLNDTISSEGNEIQALQESLHSESDRILVLEKNLDVVPRQMSHMIEQLETENNDRGARIEELEAENNDRGARIEELEAENNDRGARIEELEAENNDRGARIEELEAENRTRDAHIGTLINQVTELKKLSNWQLIELQKLQESDDALPEVLDKGAFLPEKLKDRATSATDLAKSRKKGKNKAHSKYDGCGSSSRRR